MVAWVPAAISPDPVRRPERRDTTPVLLHVEHGVLHVRHRDGRVLLQVPAARVGTQPLPGGVALALAVDSSVLRVDFRLPERPRPGLGGLPRRALGRAADARAVRRRHLILRAVR